MAFTWDLSGKRVAVALSGGVDSAVVAALLKEQGADVVCLTMLVQKTDTAEAAAQIARNIGVEHYIIDLTARFESCVMEAFADSYLRGQTPSPCVHCNRHLKFGDLMEVAKEKGCEALATGHYVRRREGNSGTKLHQAIDLSRDQSYFLFSLSQEQLNFSRFPLGDKTKKDIRAMAQERGLPFADKKDSQDICFVPDGDYVSVVERLRPEAKRSGNIVDQEGCVLGQHDGIIHFTVGQRKGLGLSARAGDDNDPLYVVALDAAKGEVAVGPREALARKQVELRDLNWLDREVPAEGLVVTVRLRSTQQPVPARFFREGEAGGRIVLDEPMYGVSPGQAGVIYHESRVLGGGWIVEGGQGEKEAKESPKAP